MNKPSLDLGIVSHVMDRRRSDRSVTFVVQTMGSVVGGGGGVEDTDVRDSMGGGEISKRRFPKKSDAHSSSDAVMNGDTRKEPLDKASQTSAADRTKTFV